MNKSECDLIKLFLLLGKRNGKEYNKNTLSQGISTDKEGINPKLININKEIFDNNLTIISNRIGYDYQLSTKRLDQLFKSTSVDKIILFLKEYKYCIVDEIDNNNYSIEYYDNNNKLRIKSISKDELSKKYDNMALLLTINPLLTNINYKRIIKESLLTRVFNKVKRTYIDVILASIIINIFLLALPLYTLNIYAKVAPTGSMHTLFVFSLGIILVTILDTLLRFLRIFYIEKAAKSIDRYISSSMMKSILDTRMLSMPFPIGSVSNTFKEFESIKNMLSSNIITLLVDLPLAITLISLIYILNSTLAIITMVSILVILFASIIISSIIKNKSKDIYTINQLKNTFLIETLQNIETIKVLNKESYILSIYDNIVNIYSNKIKSTRSLGSYLSTIIHFMGQLNIILLVAFGAYMIYNNDTTFGVLVAAIILSSRILSPMSNLSHLIINRKNLQDTFNSIEDMLNLPKEHSKEYINIVKAEGSIKLENINFSYDDVKILKDINLEIKPKEKIAIIGHSGCGKTTLAKLLVGLYSEYKGSVTLDDIELSSIDPIDLRNNISYLSQNPSLFSGTIKSNIKFENIEASDEEMIKSIRISGGVNFINSLSEGYSSQIKEAGANLSGGQIQLVALARTILSNKDIVILDEPTKSLDTNSEKIVHRNLKNYLKDKTSIIITHKASDLYLADRIILMNKGTIMMDGTKEEIEAIIKKNML